MLLLIVLVFKVAAEGEDLQASDGTDPRGPARAAVAFSSAPPPRSATGSILARVRVFQPPLLSQFPMGSSCLCKQAVWPDVLLVAIRDVVARMCHCFDVDGKTASCLSASLR